MFPMMPGLDFKPGEATSYIDRDFGRSLLKSGFRSDFTIKCRGREWKVHKEMLADRSDYFHRMFDGDWKECTMGFVEFDDEPDIIRIVIEYIYTLDFDTMHLKGSDEKDFCRRVGITTFSPLTNPNETKWKTGLGRSWTIEAREQSNAIHMACMATRLVLVYAMSNKLGIMMDRDTGISKMCNSSGIRWTLWFDQLCHSSMHQVLSLAFKVLPKEPEFGLRTWLLNACIRNVEIIKANLDIVALLEREEPEAWSIVA